MDRGIYAAASGGLANVRHLEVISNNLANVNTVGFKAQRLVTEQQSFGDTLAGQLADTPARARADHRDTPGVVNPQTLTDFTPGPVRSTDNPLHVALTTPRQFFVVDNGDGESYTRAGNFTLDAERNLITPDGLPVLGNGGTITLPAGDVFIGDNGEILVDGQTVNQLQIVEIDNLNALQRTDGSRFTLTGNAQAAAIDNPQVITKSVEMPNVNIVESMVKMISAQRAFESYQKTVRTIDELNEQAIRNGRLTG